MASKPKALFGKAIPGYKNLGLELVILLYYRYDINETEK